MTRKISLKNGLRIAGVLAAVIFLAFIVYRQLAFFKEREILKQIIGRLKADSRIAQVLVTDLQQDPATQKTLTTIKFLEYDTEGRPLGPRYFTFEGNIIQFQSLVVRFQDFYVERGDRIRGKSAYLFLKVFFLNGPNTQVFDITPVFQIPRGYKIEGNQTVPSVYERMFWQKFWDYALNPAEAKRVGIKSAQIEAPGTMFIPGTLYTIKIEHDGGMRIDAEPIPDILKGERILF